MGPLNSLFRIITVILPFLTALPIYAQSLPDVVKAFNATSDEAQVSYINKNHIKIPSGGHLQGIQCLSDSQVLITASSGSYSYYLKADKNRIQAIQKISDAPFRHAGGCQMSDHRLAVGIEDNIAKDQSNIVLISFDNNGNQTSQSIIAHRSGSVKRSTAGAVGMTRMHTGRYLIAVGDWDSRNIDLYISKAGMDTAFDLSAAYQVSKGDRWPSYQSINLLTDTTGIYMIGLALEGASNRADLYKIEISGRTDVKLISTRYFKCKGGAGFRYAAGIYISDSKLSIYTCGRNMTAKTPLNIFR